MSEYIYLKFAILESKQKESRTNSVIHIFRKIGTNILKRFIPLANPDFENDIDKVIYWLLELEAESGIPKREIGLDVNHKPLVKMPYKNNVGYWIDNNLLHADFIRLFNISALDKSTFQKYWNALNKLDNKISNA